jgi:Cupin domain
MSGVTTIQRSFRSSHNGIRTLLWLNMGVKLGQMLAEKLLELRATVGPVHHPFIAPEYLLRINYVSGPPGATTPVHTHPGSEAFYVLAGRLDQRTPHGAKHVWAGLECRHANGDLEQRRERSEGPNDVRSGRR